MSIKAISSGPPPLSQLQSLAPVKKNDHDGDEANGIDPANEKAKEAAKALPSQSSGNPNLGGKFDKTT